MHRQHNGLKTAVLLGGMSALILLIGSFFGRTGLIIGLVVALLTNGYAYFNSDKIALRSMRARPVSEAENPELYRIVRELSTQARQPMRGSTSRPPRRRMLSPPAATRATRRSAARPGSCASSTSGSCAAYSATNWRTSTTATS